MNQKKNRRDKKITRRGYIGFGITFLVFVTLTETIVQYFAVDQLLKVFNVSPDKTVDPEIVNGVLTVCAIFFAVIIVRKEFEYPSWKNITPRGYLYTPIIPLMNGMAEYIKNTLTVGQPTVITLLLIDGALFSGFITWLSFPLFQILNDRLLKNVVSD